MLLYGLVNTDFQLSVLNELVCTVSTNFFLINQLQFQFQLTLIRCVSSDLCVFYFCVVAESTNLNQTRRMYERCANILRPSSAS